MSTSEQRVLLAVLATLSISLAIVAFDSWNDAPVAVGPSASATGALGLGAPAVPTAGPAPSAPTATPTLPTAPATDAADLDGFVLTTEDRGLYIVAGDTAINIRSLPGTTAAIVRQMELGDGAMALATGRLASSQTESWREVEYLGVTGWVRSDLVIPADAN